MGTLLQDLKYAMRMLVKSPGFTIVAVLTLALGIGANTAIFSVVNAVLLRPLPIRDPGRVVVLEDELPKVNLPRAPVSPLQLRDYSAHPDIFESTAGLADANVNLTGSGHPRRLQAMRATASLFSLLGVSPILGRSFTAADDSYGASHVAILSQSLWHGAFGSNRSAIGKFIQLDGVSYEVIGVLPEKLEILYPDMQIWIPLAFSPQDFTEDNRWNLSIEMVARLRPGVTLPHAQSEMTAEAARVVGGVALHDPTHLNIVSDFNIGVRPLADEQTAGLRAPLYVLLAAVFLVLLIACANIAGLLLARAGTRSREMTIRAALGARRGRIVAQLLTESLLLSLAGGASGLLLADWSIAALVRFAPPALPHASAIGLDPRVFAFTLAVSLACGIFFGLVPALHASRPDPCQVLKEGGRTTSGGVARHHLRRALIVAEFALTFVLLVSSGLLLRSMANLLRVNPGFDPSNVLLMQTDLPMPKYTVLDRIPAFAKELLARAENMPGVLHAAVADNPPFSPHVRNSIFTIPGYNPGPNQPQPHADLVASSPDYFSTLRIPLLHGRVYTQAEMNASSTVVIDEALAKRFWPNQNPVGKRLDFGPGQETIVGVVATVRSYNLAVEPKGTIYDPVYPPEITLLVRTASNSLALAPALRQQIESLDADQPVFGVATMQQRVDASLAQRRFAAVLLGLFAALALILAGIGLDGVIAYLVMQRTHEIGIRMALGAQPRDVLRLILREGVVVLSAGLVIGLAGAFALTRLLGSLLYGVQPQDPMTLSCVAFVLSAVALIACYIPARRAMRVDPMVALRYE